MNLESQNLFMMDDYNKDIYSPSKVDYDEDANGNMSSDL